MSPTGVRHYLSEIRRVLRPGGRAYSTFFLLDDTWRLLEADERNPFPMPHELTDYCRFHSSEDPMLAVGYTPLWVLTEVDEKELEVFVLRLGNWCGRPASVASGVGWQDVVVLRRRASEQADAPGLTA